MSNLALLSAVIFLPTFGAALLPLFDRKAVGSMRVFTVVIAAVTLGLTLLAAGRFDPAEGGMQLVAASPWIPVFGVEYRLGLDGISVPLLVMAAGIFVLAALASWSITESVRGYLALFLLLETGVLGVFLALDFVLFYVFWEVMLLPMYFLIGLWGGPRREYAAIKFFLYTLLGSVLILIAMLALYFNADLDGGRSFNITVMAEAAADGRIDPALQTLCFWLLLVGFVIKLPVVPLHTWLPDAHVEAPTPVSMILAGVLLKTGGYGLLRVAWPICPAAVADAAPFLTGLGVVCILYGALVALAQTDLKRLVAYSSVSHMGYVLMGLSVWSAGEDLASWRTGVSGALFQMVGHGITSAGLFFVVGVLYDRVKHREIEQFGNVTARMPFFAACAFVLFFASLGLPALCGFPGEFATVLAAWPFSRLAGVLAALGIVLTAAYLLWTLQRVFLGGRYLGADAGLLTRLRGREGFVAGTLVLASVLFGVAPMLVLGPSEASVQKLTADMARGATVEMAFGSPTAIGETTDPLDADDAATGDASDDAESNAPSVDERP